MEPTDLDESALDENPATDENELMPPIESPKSDLKKRRMIDNYLEERRLQKQLRDYDFDL
jgi:hypothetical protein